MVLGGVGDLARPRGEKVGRYPADSGDADFVDKWDSSIYRAASAWWRSAPRSTSTAWSPITTSRPPPSTAAEVLIGANATSFAAKADLVLAKLAAIRSAVSAAPTAMGDGGATFKAALVTALNLIDFNVAAVKAKVE